MTCNLASLSGAMYHGFEGAISTFGVYFPYLNLALKWSNEPGPPHVCLPVSHFKLLDPGAKDLLHLVKPCE